MGRGLSDLQKTILRLALKEGEVTQAMILHAHYGWEPKEDCLNVSTEERLLRGYGQIFSTSIENYQAATVAASRAVTRLRQRGLVEGGWKVTLTEAGSKAAESIG